MTAFEDREKAFENKFELDEELEFKINSRMARLFGQWAAEQLGLTGKDAEAYVNEAVSIEVAKTGRTTLAAKALADFLAKGLDISKHHVEREMENCYNEARARLVGPSPQTIH